MTPQTELDRLFAQALAMTEQPMKLVTIPADLPPERDPGVIDVNEDTLADRATVSDIREALRKRDRNATPRAPQPPEAA